METLNFVKIIVTEVSVYRVFYVYALSKTMVW